MAFPSLLLHVILHLSLLWIKINAASTLRLTHVETSRLLATSSYPSGDIQPGPRDGSLPSFNVRMVTFWDDVSTMAWYASYFFLPENNGSYTHQPASKLQSALSRNCLDFSMPQTAGDGGDYQVDPPGMAHERYCRMDVPEQAFLFMDDIQGSTKMICSLVQPDMCLTVQQNDAFFVNKNKWRPEALQWKVEDATSYYWEMYGFLGPNVLSPGQFIYNGQEIHSDGGRFALRMRNDHRASLYDYLQRNEYWITASEPPPYGGDFFLHARNQQRLKICEDSRGFCPFPIWQVNLEEIKTTARRLVLQDDGNLVFYPDSGLDNAAWSSNATTSSTIFTTDSLGAEGGGVYTSVGRSLVSGQKLCYYQQLALVNNFRSVFLRMQVDGNLALYRCNANGEECVVPFNTGLKQSQAQCMLFKEGRFGLQYNGAGGEGYWDSSRILPVVPTAKYMQIEERHNETTPLILEARIALYDHSGNLKAATPWA